MMTFFISVLYLYHFFGTETIRPETQTSQTGSIGNFRVDLLRARALTLHKVERRRVALLHSNSFRLSKFPNPFRTIKPSIT